MEQIIKGIKDLNNLKLCLNNKNQIDNIYKWDNPCTINLFVSLLDKNLIISSDNSIHEENYLKLDMYSWQNDINRVDIFEVNSFDSILNEYKSKNLDVHMIIKEKVNLFTDSLLSKNYNNLCCSLIYNPVNYEDTINNKEFGYIYPIFNISLHYKNFNSLILYYYNGLSIMVHYSGDENDILINDIKNVLKMTL